MKKTIALLYHEVANTITESGFQNKDNLPYIHSIAQFKRDLTVVEDLADKIDSEVIFTFDDGGMSNLRSADILSQMGKKAYFFITTGKVGKSLFLDREGIRSIVRQGHIVGSHSHTHPMIFRTLSYKKMLEEWKVSKEILEEILGLEILSCSVPGGDSDEKTYESAVEAGFLQIFDSEPIVEKRFLGEAEIIGRMSIKNSTTEEQLKKILTLESLSSIQRMRKIKKLVKRLIFPLHNYLQSKKNEITY